MWGGVGLKTQLVLDLFHQFQKFPKIQKRTFETTVNTVKCYQHGKK